MTFGDIFWLFVNPFEALRGVRDFLELGGPVLQVILLATLILWLLIFERFSFLRRPFEARSAAHLVDWQNRSEHDSWAAQRIREMMISDMKLQAQANIAYIKLLVALAPFLGLLGTVTGMIEVFDVMAVTGSGNARAMAAGIAKATLPTMAGMVVALSGLFFSNLLDRRAAGRVRDFAEQLARG